MLAMVSLQVAMMPHEVIGACGDCGSDPMADGGACTTGSYDACSHDITCTCWCQTNSGWEWKPMLPFCETLQPCSVCSNPGANCYDSAGCAKDSTWLANDGCSAAPTWEGDNACTCVSVPDKHSSHCKFCDQCPKPTCGGAPTGQRFADGKNTATACPGNDCSGCFEAHSACPIGSGVSAAGTDTADTLCAACTGTTFSDVEDKTSACAEHSTCAEGFGVSAAGTASTDTVCAACTGTTFADVEDKTSACAEHSTCGEGFGVSAAGTASTDTVCAACTGTTFSDCSDNLEWRSVDEFGFGGDFVDFFNQLAPFFSTTSPGHTNSQPETDRDTAFASYGCGSCLRNDGTFCAEGETSAEVTCGSGDQKHAERVCHDCDAHTADDRRCDSDDCRWAPGGRCVPRRGGAAAERAVGDVCVPNAELTAGLFSNTCDDYSVGSVPYDSQADCAFRSENGEILLGLSCAAPAICLLALVIGCCCIKKNRSSGKRRVAPNGGTVRMIVVQQAEPQPPQPPQPPQQPREGAPSPSAAPPAAQPHDSQTYANAEQQKLAKRAIADNIRAQALYTAAERETEESARNKMKDRLARKMQRDSVGAISAAAGEQPPQPGGVRSLNSTRT